MEALAKAERPLFFLGGGVTLADVTEDVRAIVAATGIPVVSTLMALGCADSEDEASFGMAGMHGSYAANMAIMGCDLLIGLGLRFDDRVTGVVEEFAPEAKIAHFEIDAAEVNKNVPVAYPVVGDLRWSVPLLKKKIDAAEVDYRAKSQAWRAHTIGLHRKHPFAYEENSEAIMPQSVIAAVSRLAEDDAIIVTDVGQHQMWAAQFFKARRPRQFLTSGGLGTMGYGLPAAIGAKLARPGQRVILFTGDGSIMMNCQELATAADYGVNVTVIVLHNRLLGMVAQWQRMFYEQHLSESTKIGRASCRERV